MILYIPLLEFELKIMGLITKKGHSGEQPFRYVVKILITSLLYKH